MITSVMNNGHVAYNLKCFVCDTKKDCDYLPVDVISPGSKAFCIETQKKFMFSGTKGWVEVQEFPW